MPKLPIVSLSWSKDKPPFEPTPDFWSQVDRALPRLTDEQKGELANLVQSFARDVEASEKGVSVATAEARVRKVREAAEQFKAALMGWEGPKADNGGDTGDERAEKRSSAVVYDMFTDRQINKVLADVNIRFFDWGGYLASSKSKPRMSLKLVKPITVAGLAQSTMNSLMFGCDGALLSLEKMKEAKNFDEDQAWDHMVCSLADFWSDVTGSFPTVSWGTTSAYSRSKFVGLVFAVHRQFSSERQARWRGREHDKGATQRRVSVADEPPNSLAKAIHRVLQKAGKMPMRK
jgi:hypothetical protein